MFPTRRPSLVLVALLAGCLAVASARADLIHLKNGATIVADFWQEIGDNLVIRQGQGTILVPRADVERIERTAAPPAAGKSTPAPGQATPPQNAGPERPPDAPQGASPTQEEILRRIETLKRRQGDQPLARADTTRELVALLNALGTRAYKAREYDEAATRFREALGYDPRHAGASFGLAATYFVQGQDIYARSTIEQALLHNPDDAPLHALLGDVYYSQERLEDALASWQLSLSLRPNNDVRNKIDKLRREQAVDGEYRRSDAAHFTLKYDGQRGGADLGPEILAFLEGQFPTLVNRFGYYPRQPIVVIVYPEQEFRDATLAESNVAGLFDGKIRAPMGGLRALGPEARGTLLHELAHAFIAGKSRGTAPRWLHEGLAQHLEGKTTPIATAAVLAKEFNALQDKADWGTTFSYPSALSFVEFLVEREGFPRLMDILEAMSQGQTAEAAFEASTRYSLQELREAWGMALVRKDLR